MVVTMRPRASSSTADGEPLSGATRRRDVYLTLVNFGAIYFLVYVSFSGLEALQSTVNVERGLGTTSVGVLYASLIAASLLLGPTVVHRLRAKRTLYLAWTANAAFAVANAFPRWATLMPAAAFVGVTLASCNIVHGLYVNALAEQLTALQHQRDITTTGRRRHQNNFVFVTSILIAFLNTGSIIGSLTGSLVIGSGSPGPSPPESSEEPATTATNGAETGSPVSSCTPGGSGNNESTLTAAVAVGVCGADHCPYIEEHIRSFASHDDRLVLIVGGVFLLCVVAALALTCVLRPLPFDRPCCGPAAGPSAARLDADKTTAVLAAAAPPASVRSRIVSTLRLLANGRLLLLIPTMMLMGVLTSFAIGAFNQSFVACSLGIGMIGYAMTGYRLSYITASLVSGQLIRCVRRRTLVAGAMVANVVVVASWFAWAPPPSAELAVAGGDGAVTAAAAIITWSALNGAIIGVLRAVVFSLFPALFPDALDHALAQLAVWDSLGTAVAYFANSRLCFGVKAAGVGALTAVALGTYVALELVIARDARRLREREAAAAARSSGQLVGHVVLDASLIAEQSDAKKPSVSLLIDDGKIIIAAANNNKLAPSLA